MALPRIADSLGLSVAWIGDPLGWPEEGGDWILPRDAFQAGASLPVPGSVAGLRCIDAAERAESLFDPPAGDLPQTERLAELVRQALVTDRCALMGARRALAEERFDIVYLRLQGYYDVAYQFAGWRASSPARSAAEREIEAYGRTLVRYAREIGSPLGQVLAEGRERGMVALVSPHGIRSRHDASQLVDALLGRMGPTGTHAGPPPGLLLLSAEGVRPDRRRRPAPLVSVLPTLLWASGLPPSEQMGSIVFDLFDPSFTGSTPVVSVPTYARTPPGDGERR
jgi:hypothetical protein